MSLRIETDDEGKRWIHCDFCINSDIAEEPEDCEAEFYACGWTENDDENYCPLCTKTFEKMNRKDSKRKLCKFCKKAARVSTGYVVSLVCV
ncbi:MAG: hypothetical protein RBR02_09490 [Desulfuromonadaceae bacterium]|nr:hypothetical protein [Desulfuromonadaceae bacterium]